MKYNKRPGLEFVVDSNVHIEVVSPQKVIKQTVDRHNKATKRMVEGLLRFVRGEFNTSYERTKESEIYYKNDAKNYIPCFIGVGTGGIRLNSEGFPDIDSSNPRKPPMEPSSTGEGLPWWDADTNYVKFTDRTLYKEVTDVSRQKISVLGFDESANVLSQIGDVEQIVYHTEIQPGTYNTIYNGEIKDIFITELGLFASNVPGAKDLLARVILKNEYEVTKDVDEQTGNIKETIEPTGKTQILYVRPQDTIILRWTISIIALDDANFVDEESSIELDDGVHMVNVGDSIVDFVAYDGTNVVDDELTP